MMRCYQCLTFVLVLFLLCAKASSQDRADSVDAYVTIEAVDVNPEYIDGHAQLYNDISFHLKYPAGCYQIEGKVHVGYVIEKDGSVTNIEIVKSLHPKMDDAAIKAIEEVFKTTKYSAGQKDGVPVRVKMTLPIYFKLGN